MSCHCFSLFLFLFFFLIMWLSYCTWLKIGRYLLQLLTNGLQRYLLKRPVVLWFWVMLVLKMFFQSHLLLSLYTCTCTFFIPVSGKSCRCYYRLFLFSRRYLPFSVQAGLQIFTYLCDFCFCFMDLFFRTTLFEAISLSFDAFVVLVFVTCVLALCKDGAKQISDLPFIFLLKNKLWHTELMTQNSISNACVICRG